MQRDAPANRGAGDAQRSFSTLAGLLHAATAQFYRGELLPLWSLRSAGCVFLKPHGDVHVVEPGSSYLQGVLTG